MTDFTYSSDLNPFRIPTKIMTIFKKQINTERQGDKSSNFTQN